MFGIEHPITINALKNYTESPICSPYEWDNIEIMTQAFKQHLKHKIAVSEIIGIIFLLNGKNNQIL